MNSSWCLAEQRENQRVGHTSAWQFHVVGQLIGRNPLQHELARIGVFAFISLQRNVSQVKPKSAVKGQNQSE